MTFNGYQSRAKSTARTNVELEQPLAIWALGLTGEAGEVADIIKKVLGHGHPLNREKIAEELGDVLWYVAVLANELDYSLSDIANRNIEKLKRRYPEGFSVERSLKR
jgi:NTP pyrophosphatase (non-canonical NTP hydrolase)